MVPYVLLYMTGRPHLPEQALLRDALYLLQGISGKYVRFVEEGRDDEEDNRIIFVDDPVMFRMFFSEFATNDTDVSNLL